MDINTIAYIAFGFSGTIMLCTIYGFLSYKSKMDERHNYLYRRIESLYDQFEKINIDAHERSIQGNGGNCVAVSITPSNSGDYSIPLLDPINYSTHPLMLFDNTYDKI